VKYLYEYFLIILFLSVMANTTRTQLALGIGEFDRYTVSDETTITFCLKELKSLLAFSESVGIPVSINFETAGRYLKLFHLLL